MHRKATNDAVLTQWPQRATPKGWRNRATGTACVSRRSFFHGGFTLVEVLAAVALLSVGLLAVLSAGQAGRETQQRAVYLSAARTIGQTKIDEARATGFSLIEEMVEGNSSDSSLPPGNTVNVAVANYTNGLGQPDPDLKRVTVTVTWPEAESSRSLVYETLIANNN